MPLLTKLAAAAALACAIAVAVPAAASAAPAAPAADQVPCAGNHDFLWLSLGDNSQCYANFGPAFPNFRAAVLSSGNNCGTAYFTYPDGTHGQLGFNKWETHDFPHNNQDQIVLVNQLDLGCIPG